MTSKKYCLHHSSAKNVKGGCKTQGPLVDREEFHPAI